MNALVEELAERFSGVKSAGARDFLGCCLELALKAQAANDSPGREGLDQELRNVIARLSAHPATWPPHSVPRSGGVRKRPDNEPA